MKEETAKKLVLYSIDIGVPIAIICLFVRKYISVSSIYYNLPCEIAICISGILMLNYCRIMFKKTN